jgi:hypothetical protein
VNFRSTRDVQTEATGVGDFWDWDEIADWVRAIDVQLRTAHRDRADRPYAGLIQGRTKCRNQRSCGP